MHPPGRADRGPPPGPGGPESGPRRQGSGGVGPVFPVGSPRWPPDYRPVLGRGRRAGGKGGAPLPGFAGAGADKKFAWAQARNAGNRVVLSSSQVAKPVAVRYAWADNPAGANSHTAEGLPAALFRTDEFAQ